MASLITFQPGCLYHATRELWLQKNTELFRLLWLVTQIQRNREVKNNCGQEISLECQHHILGNLHQDAGGG